MSRQSTSHSDFARWFPQGKNCRTRFGFGSQQTAERVPPGYQKRPRPVPIHCGASPAHSGSISTTTCLNAGVFDSGSTARGISPFDSGQYIIAFPGRTSKGRTR